MNSNLPNGWNSIRLKYLIKSKVSDGPHETPEFISSGIPFLSVDGIQNGNLDFEKCRYISEEDYTRFKRKTIVEKNDILLGKAASIGKIARVNVDFEFSVWSPLAIIKPNVKKVLPEYLEFALKSSYSQYQIEIFATSNTQKNISMDEIPKILIFLPTIENQKKIINYLHKHTNQINELISKKENLIELLQEEKTAIINQAVTKGLNKDVKLKDSGIEWLGEIPEHWKVSKLKYTVACKITDGPHVTPDFIPEGIPFISAEAIKENKIDINAMRGFITKEQAEIFNEKSMVMENDILFCKSGSTTGKSALVDFEPNFVIWSPLAIIRADKLKANHNYLFLYLQSNFFRKQVEIYWSFGTQPNIGMNVIENLIFIMPPIIEQNEICNFISKELIMIEGIIMKIQSEIELLHEYREALISEAVTGKIDVRGYV